MLVFATSIEYDRSVTLYKFDRGNYFYNKSTPYSVPDMTYNVFGGTLSLTLSINLHHTTPNPVHVTNLNFVRQIVLTAMLVFITCCSKAHD